MSVLLQALSVARPVITPQAGRWDWIYAKTMLSIDTGLSDDVLHVFAGLAILTVAALVLRRVPWHWAPWLVAAAIEFANEAYDVMQTAYSTDEGNIGSAWHDFWMTMLWPTVILLSYGWLARRAARLPGERRGEGANGGTDIVAR